MSTSKVVGQRRSPRRKFERPIGVLMAGRYELCRAWQVGEGGMLISGPVPFAIDQQLVVNFILPGGKAVIVRGVIRYELPLKQSAQTTGYGVQFSDLSFELKRMIRHFIASQVQSHED